MASELAKPVEAPKPECFPGTAALDPQRDGRDAWKIRRGWNRPSHQRIGADVTVRIAIEACIASGVTDNAVCIVTENARTLKLTSHRFEKD